jgi:hypothetical protein
MSATAERFHTRRDFMLGTQGESDVTTIIERGGDDSGTAVLAIAVIVAAVVVALFAFGAFDGAAPVKAPDSTTTINVTPAPAPEPATPAPTPNQ